MIIRLTINLTEKEKLALMRVAARDLQDLSELAHSFIRKALIELGELQNEEEKENEQ